MEPESSESRPAVTLTAPPVLAPTPPAGHGATHSPAAAIQPSRPVPSRGVSGGQPPAHRRRRCCHPPRSGKSHPHAPPVALPVSTVLTDPAGAQTSPGAHGHVAALAGRARVGGRDRHGARVVRVPTPLVTLTAPPVLAPTPPAMDTAPPTAPLLPSPMPAVSVSAPPAALSAVVLPAVTVTAPPAPVLPSPTLREIAPPAPPVALPVSTVNAPVAPEPDSPVVSAMSPLTPEEPELAVAIVMEPESSEVPTPLVTLTAPPVDPPLAASDRYRAASRAAFASSDRHSATDAVAHASGGASALARSESHDTTSTRCSRSITRRQREAAAITDVAAAESERYRPTSAASRVASREADIARRPTGSVACEDADPSRGAGGRVPGAHRDAAAHPDVALPVLTVIFPLSPEEPELAVAIVMEPESSESRRRSSHSRRRPC